MQCNVIEPELIGFHFADLDDQVRTRVEAHLRGCRACLDAYLSLKHSVEGADLKPSEQARARLRDAVARELSAAEPAAWSWWERPLAVAFATAAVTLATLTVSRL